MVGTPGSVLVRALPVTASARNPPSLEGSRAQLRPHDRVRFGQFDADGVAAGNDGDAGRARLLPHQAEFVGAERPVKPHLALPTAIGDDERCNGRRSDR
jgi:hypothetical protein